jgi:hypothetical protein
MTVSGASMTATDQVAASAGKSDTRPVAPGRALTVRPRLEGLRAPVMRSTIYLGRGV